MIGLQSWLGSAIARHRVPGAVVARWSRGETRIACAGFASLSPATPVSEGTRFRYGSTTKLLTALTVLRQVDLGGLELDAPIIRLLPHFRTRDGDRSARVSPRHLLQHSAGFFGDLYESSSDSEDAIRDYVGRLASVAHSFEPGELLSYSNAGYVVLAHLTEQLERKSWRDAVCQSVLEPLSMLSVELQPAWPPRATTGHRLEGGTPVPWMEAVPLPSLAPAGSMAVGTAGDLLKLARALCEETSSESGACMLSRSLARAQREHAIESPSPSFAMAWGLGVMQFDREARLFGHDGATPGQTSFLRYVPDMREAFVLLANGGDGRALCQEFIEELRLVQSEFPEAPRFTPLPPERRNVSADAFVGIYSNDRYRVSVTAQGAGLRARFEPAANAGDVVDVFECLMEPLQEGSRPELFAAAAPGSVLPTTHRFSRFDAGRARLLNFRGRIFERQN